MKHYEFKEASQVKNLVYVDGILEAGREVVKKEETIFIIGTDTINLKAQNTKARFILIKTC